MKGIKKTLVAGILACATFNAQAEVSPFGYGIKAGGGFSSAVGYGDKVKIGGKDAQGTFFDHFVAFGKLYGEYAFTDYIGFGLEAGYMGQGASLTGEDNQGGNTNSSTIAMSNHGIATELSLCVYPLGREAEEGILKVMIGGAPYFSFASSYKADNSELTLSDNQKKEKVPFDVAVTGGIGYELPFGLSFEVKYGYGFMNRFNTDQGRDQTIYSNVSELKKLRIQYGTVGLGYNFASLFSE